ncbi:MAG: aspartate carbamoyltransferase catalytic subunit [Schleiferiaceae bacterium]|nr:MAG: aspartate carbamoyltransferase [Owenweeksia sp. TMED14]|tara:strand:- start:1507 stop:2448 length:942 start_codon:yes stop_codon:yes gene_type:complete
MLKTRLSKNHLLGIKDLTKDDIRLIFHWTKQFKEVISRPIKKVPSLRDITVANLFFENSTRTRLSFELAEKRLSADVINFSASNSSLKKGESLVDTINNILAMKVDVIVLRHPEPGSAKFLSQEINSQIINAGDGTHEHPTQALLDSFSIEERLGDLKNKKVVIIGDIMHSRVAISNILCIQKLGGHVAVCGPNTLIPRKIESLGVTIINDVAEALEWADAANILRVQHERMESSYFPSIREYQMQFGITMKRLNKVKNIPVIMHPGPINRGVEISSEVADSEHSIILDQVENGVALRMSVLYLLASQAENID